MNTVHTVEQKEAQKKHIKGIQKYFLVGVLLILLVVLGIFASPFFLDLLIAGVLVTAVYPIHKKILALVPFSRSLGSLISMLLLTIVVLLPFTLFTFFVIQQAGDAYTVISGKITEITHRPGVVESPISILGSLPFGDKLEAALKFLPVTSNDVLKTLGESAGQVSGFLLGQTTNILKHLSIFILHIIVFLMVLFYFLRDGNRLVSYIKSLLPLSNVYREELFNKLGQLSYGIIYGIFGGAIIQGFLVGLAFAVAGFENAAFWGAIAALFAPVPFLGPMIVWIPAFIILAIGGKWLAATLFLLWCMGVVGTADNFIKPYLIGASSSLNPMALLIAILGGTFVFGIKGLLFGPFILTLTLSFLHIYQLEYKMVLDKMSELPPEEESNILPRLKKLIAHQRKLMMENRKKKK